MSFSFILDKAVGLHRRLIASSFVALVVALVGAAPVRAAAPSDAVVLWNVAATDATAAAGLDPMTESRILAIIHLAVHDAVNAVDRRFAPYAFDSNAREGASAEVAASAAAHATLSALVPAQNDRFDSLFQKLLNQAAGSASAKEAGTTAGRAAAAAVLDRRTYDGADTQVTYTPGQTPGRYRPTPPSFAPAVLAGWGRVKPFVLKSSDQFRPAPSPALDSARYLRDYEEVQRDGAEKSRARSEEQSEIARYWYESSLQGWNRIARNMSAERGLDLWDNARLFALVNLAMADGFIAGFEAKYHYPFWRPVTAIRDGDLDGNDRTRGDGDWSSFLETPPGPDYPSTHSVLGAAAAAVLARVFGTDYVRFSMTSGAPFAGITRRFWSFSEAARENASSRVLAGIHFRSAIEAGLEQGYRVGEFAFDMALRPISERTAKTATAAAR